MYGFEVLIFFLSILVIVLPIISFIIALISRSKTKLLEELLQMKIGAVEERIIRLERKLFPEAFPAGEEKERVEKPLEWAPQPVSEAPVSAEPVTAAPFKEEKPVKEAVAAKKAEEKPPVKQEWEPASKAAESRKIDRSPLAKPEPVTAVAHPAAAKPRRKPLFKPEVWKKIEKRFLENWIGMLGAVLLVVGLSILGILAYNMAAAPILRFLLLVGVSGLLVVLFFILRTKSYWKELALWLRSAAGAVLLFACLGSGGIEGLKWIDNQLYALMLLSGGIIVNIFLAYIGGRQAFASLHVMLSLVSISIAPQQEITFIIAGIITLSGVILTFREKWEYHLFLTITCFFAYILYWYFQIPEITLFQRLLALGFVLGIFGLAALTHYREIYRIPSFSLKSYLIHLSNWCFLGAGCYLYSPSFHWISLPIGLVAVAVFLLARLAKKHTYRWLYLTDTLVAQVIAYIAVLNLFLWEIKLIPILSVLYLETLIFCSIMILENEKRLYRIGTYLHSLFNIVLAVSAFLFVKPEDSASFYSHAFALLICSVATQGYLLFWKKKTDSLLKESFSILGKKQRAAFIVTVIVLAGVIVMGLLNHFKMITGLRSEFLLLLAAISLLYSRGQFENKMAYFVDTLAAQGAAILSIALLYRWGVELTPVFSLILLESLFFTFIHLDKEKSILAMTGYLISNIALTALIINSLFRLDELTFTDLNANLILISFLFLFQTGFYIYSYRKSIGLLPGLEKNVASFFRINLEAFGVLAVGLLAVIFVALDYSYRIFEWTSFFALFEYIGPYYFILIPCALLIYLRNRFQFTGLGAALYLFILGLHMYSWYVLREAETIPLVETFVYYLPLLVLSLLFIRFASWKQFKHEAKWFGIYLFMGQLLFLSYYLFDPISPLIPGVIWLLLSVAALETSNFFSRLLGESIVKKGKMDLHFIVSGYIIVAIFLVRHIVVHLQSEAYIGIFKARLLIEILALAVFLYWFLVPKEISKRPYTKKVKLHPLFLEIAAVFSCLVVLVEVNSEFWPLVWIGMAVISLFLSRMKAFDFSRLALYSVFLFWASLFHVAFLSSPYAQDVYTAFDWKWFLAVLAILCQVVYIVLFYRMFSPDKINLPFGKNTGRLIQRIDKKRNLWIFYPLFISIAVFLCWSFDQWILTLLWTIEVFMVFLVSLQLRENHFRYLSMAALLGCLVRLVVFDLAGAHTLAKALVCIGVAVIMLLMNALYNRFKRRYEDAEKA